jgi:hypothetical protein
MPISADASSPGDLPLILCDSFHEYRRRVNQPAEESPRPIALRLIELHYPDGDVGIYDAAGNFLACEEGRDQARREADFVLTAYLNDTHWATRELMQGRGHLQMHFPEIAARYGCQSPC